MADIILILAYIAEPIIWLRSMCLKFERKYNAWVPYVSYILLDMIMTFLKTFTDVTIYTGELLFTIGSFVYVTVVILILFKGKVLGKFLHVGILFLLSLIGDTLSLGLLSLLGYSIDNISQPGILNSFATVLSKMLLLLIVKIAFNNKKTNRLDYEFIPIVFATIIMELPAIALFNKMKLINYNDSFLIIYTLGQIGLLVLVIYTMHKFRVKKQREEELLKWKRDMEMQLKGSEGAENTLENLRMLRHDIKQHVAIIKNLMDAADYERAKEYLEKIYEHVDVAEEYYTLSNRSVSITLTTLKQLSKVKGVNFYTKIMTEEFYIDDIDICTILSNVGRNAIEAAEKTNERYCKLVITASEEGYHVCCENTYSGKLSELRGEYKTTKGEGHGYGIKIIRNIVKHYNGKACFSGKDGVFKVDIFIPGGKNYAENNYL